MGDGTISPLSLAVSKLTHSLAVSFETGKAALDLPARFAPVQRSEQDRGE
jgi:hypothetical protein